MKYDKQLIIQTHIICCTQIHSLCSYLVSLHILLQQVWAQINRPINWKCASDANKEYQICALVMYTLKVTCTKSFVGHVHTGLVAKSSSSASKFEMYVNARNRYFYIRSPEMNKIGLSEVDIFSWRTRTFVFLFWYDLWHLNKLINTSTLSTPHARLAEGNIHLIGNYWSQL